MIFLSKTSLLMLFFQKALITSKQIKLVVYTKENEYKSGKRFYP